MTGESYSGVVCMIYRYPTVDRSVKIYSVSRPQDVWVPNYNEQSRPATISSSVRSMLEAIQVLWKMNMPAEFVSLY